MDNLTDLVPLVLVGLIGLVVGALFGILAANFMNRSENTAQKRGRNHVEVLRVWKHRQSGDMQLEHKGTAITSPDKLDAKRNSDLKRTLEEVNRWAGLPELAKGLQAPPPTVDQPTPTPAPLKPVEINNFLPKLDELYKSLFPNDPIWQFELGSTN